MIDIGVMIAASCPPDTEYLKSFIKHNGFTNNDVRLIIMKEINVGAVVSKRIGLICKPNAESTENNGIEHLDGR